MLHGWAVAPPVLTGITGHPFMVTHKQRELTPQPARQKPIKERKVNLIMVKCNYDKTVSSHNDIT